MPEPSRPVSPPSTSSWHPLRIPLFRNLLIADLVSDIGTFMQSVGAAWLMTLLTTSPMYVALIQTASALPFFVLALPAGSVGDIFDRRKLILRTELWMLGIAIVLAATTITHTMAPWLLLLLSEMIMLTCPINGSVRGKRWQSQEFPMRWTARRPPHSASN